MSVLLPDQLQSWASQTTFTYSLQESTILTVVIKDIKGGDDTWPRSLRERSKSLCAFPHVALAHHPPAHLCVQSGSLVGLVSAYPEFSYEDTMD